MHRTEGLNHLRNQFIEGPSSSRVTVEWLNTIQEEICTVIEQAGLEVHPDAASDEYGQLLRAVQLIGEAASVEAGTEMLVFADTAPIGWTLRVDLNDVMAMITKGSEAGGHVGGSALPGGTWQLPDHTLIGSELPYHRHSLPYRERDVIGAGTGILWYAPYPAIPTTFYGAGGAHNHGLMWRPRAINAIVCSKDTI